MERSQLSEPFPPIIQGGMGVGVSSWRLANSVAAYGQLGVVSGTALDLVFARRLQSGDPGGHLRRALAAFPVREMAERIYARYFVADGKSASRPFTGKPMVGQEPSPELQQLLVVANFCEVYLAKSGHSGRVGINFLNKIQTPLLASLYGAILAGVDVVIVGAGIPFEIPGLLEKLTRSESVSLDLQVHNAPAGQRFCSEFTPRDILSTPPSDLRKPCFFPVIASATLASALVRKCPGGIDGLIVEAHSAGGHNAPPRGKSAISETGEPVYGPRDEVDLPAIQKLGVPFWLAGSRGSPEGLAAAQAQGAAGIQVGTLFAFCRESGMRDDIKRRVVRQCQVEEPKVFTDPLASPTGFPFKVLALPETISDTTVYEGRQRQCDLGYLRQAYVKKNGSLGWRCPAEDPKTYVDKKEGELSETVGRKCICNGLMANIGLAQVRGDGVPEPALVTCGDDLTGIRRIVGEKRSSYSSTDVLDYLLAEERELACASSGAGRGRGGTDR